MCSCDQALELISAALDGELTAGEQAELDGHLAVCGACRALADELRELSDRMPEEVEVPEGFHRAVMDRIAAEQVLTFPVKKQKKQSWRNWVSLAAVFAVVMLGAGVSRQMGYLGGGASGGAAAPKAATEAAHLPEPHTKDNRAAGATGEPNQELTDQTTQTSPPAGVSSQPEASASPAMDASSSEEDGAAGGTASKEAPALSAVPAAEPSAPAAQPGMTTFGALGVDPAQMAVDNSRVWLVESSLENKAAVDTDTVSVATLTQAEQALVISSEGTQAILDLTDWVVTLGDPSGPDFARLVCDSATGEVIGYLPAE